MASYDCGSVIVIIITYAFVSSLNHSGFSLKTWIKKNSRVIVCVLNTTDQSKILTNIYDLTKLNNQRSTLTTVT